MTFDEIRARHPPLALALYALEPGGTVTLEVIDGAGEIFTFRGLTAEHALDQAFGAGDARPLPPEPAGAFL